MGGIIDRADYLDRRVITIIGVISLAMAVYALAPELLGDGKYKDYPIWYIYARRFWLGAPLYDNPLYLYPPTMVFLLAPFSLLPPAAFYALLIALSVAALYLSVLYSQQLAQGESLMPWFMTAIPIVMMLPQIIENFDLGQPHIVLLAIMLGGFLLLREGKPVMAGTLFGFAAALKVFPISILPYLIWRRHWSATFGMVAALLIIIFVLPSPVRGFERNINELTQWFVAMTGDEDGFGQREEQNWSWKNQSVVAITHRVVRDIDYNAVDPRAPAAFMNLMSVDYRTANFILIGVVGVIGFVFIAILLPRRDLDHRRLAEEWGILTCLMIVASPLARTYYFIWLLFPLMVLIQRGWDTQQESVKRWTFGSLALVFVLTLLQLIDRAQAYGVNSLAALVVAIALARHMHLGARGKVGAAPKVERSADLS